MTHVLVTGGAGYIGSHVVRSLLGQGHAVTVLDDLSNGDRDRLPRAARFVAGDVADRGALTALLCSHDVDTVVHLAGRKAVAESIDIPLEYYKANVGAWGAVLAAVHQAGVPRVVLSSSAAVYAPGAERPVPETAPVDPASPYGRTKLIMEWMLRDQAHATGLRWAALRYFNVAGAGAPDLGDHGVHNLVPRVFRALDEGRRPEVFGTDYATPDGTAVRDYVHVADVADAHAAVVAHLGAALGGEVFNVGGGRGASVLEVLAAVAAATGRPITPHLAPARAGDAPSVVADARRIAARIGWRARHDLAATVASAWDAWTHDTVVDREPAAS